MTFPLLDWLLPLSSESNEQNYAIRYKLEADSQNLTFRKLFGRQNVLSFLLVEGTGSLWGSGSLLHTDKRPRPQFWSPWGRCWGYVLISPVLRQSMRVCSWQDSFWWVSVCWVFLVMILIFPFVYNDSFASSTDGLDACCSFLLPSFPSSSAPLWQSLWMLVSTVGQCWLFESACWCLSGIDRPLRKWVVVERRGLLSWAWPVIDSVAMMSPRTSTLTIHRTISHRVVKHGLSITDHAGAGKTELELLCKQSNITSQYCSCFDQSPAGNCGCCRSEQNYTINSLNSFDHHSLKCD